MLLKSLYLWLIYSSHDDEMFCLHVQVVKMYFHIAAFFMVAFLLHVQGKFCFRNSFNIAKIDEIKF